MLRLRLFGISMLMLLVIACGGAVEQTAQPTAEPVVEVTNVAEPAITILALGDSLTDGFGVDRADAYPAQLERKLRADGYDVAVTNAGISGETSSAALTRLDWMLNTEPDIVIIETGGNDGLRGIDLELTAENIDALAAGFSDAGAVVVVAGMQIISNLGEQYQTEFADIYPAVAERHDALLIPFFLEGVAADPELNQPDFIHPTAEGYTVIVDNLYPVIEQAISLVE